MRLFFAVNFIPEVKDRIQQAIDDTAIVNPPWRWVGRESFHVTLKFLGDTPEDRLPGLYQCAEAVARQATPFDLALGMLGGFPNLSRPRVLFYRVERGAEPLTALASRLEGQLEEQLAIPREKRPFRAHATVARVKSRIVEGVAAKLRQAPPVGADQRVESFALMRSELRRQGAKYHQVKEFALTKSK